MHMYGLMALTGYSLIHIIIVIFMALSDKSFSYINKARALINAAAFEIYILTHMLGPFLITSSSFFLHNFTAKIDEN